MNEGPVTSMIDVPGPSFVSDVTHNVGKCVTSFTHLKRLDSNVFGVSDVMDYDV